MKSCERNEKVNRRHPSQSNPVRSLKSALGVSALAVVVTLLAGFSFIRSAEADLSIHLNMGRRAHVGIGLGMSNYPIQGEMPAVRMQARRVSQKVSELRMDAEYYEDGFSYQEQEALQDLQELDYAARNFSSTVDSYYNTPMQTRRAFQDLMADYYDLAESFHYLQANYVVQDDFNDVVDAIRQLQRYYRMNLSGSSCHRDLFGIVRCNDQFGFRVRTRIGGGCFRNFRGALVCPGYVGRHRADRLTYLPPHRRGRVLRNGIGFYNRNHVRHGINNPGRGVGRIGDRGYGRINDRGYGRHGGGVIGRPVAPPLRRTSPVIRPDHRRNDGVGRRGRDIAVPSRGAGRDRGAIGAGRGNGRDRGGRGERRRG